MAIIPQPTVTSMFDTGEETPPKGTFLATCIDIKDQFGVKRPKFSDPTETETVDLTGFLFGFRDRNGRPFKVASRTMRISGKENSNLFGFLKSWTGSAPRYGWDYMELKGRKALITVDHTPSRKYPGVVYADIVTISPVPEGMVEAPAAPMQPTMAPGYAAPAPRPAAPPPPPPPPAPVEDENDELPF